MASNLDVAKRRFKSLTKKFNRDQSLYERYDAVIQDYLNEGIVEEVTEEKSIGPMYYMPHHAVVKEERTTTKVRIVFDASSHEGNSPSLNQCLFAGPNLNPDLLSILLKFREHKVAIMADITKAFLQISLNEADRDVLRFLWTKDKTFSNEEVNLITLRMTRVPFGVTSSPFLLAATITHHLERYENIYPDIVKNMRECLYVDDLITGATDVNSAENILMKAK